MPIPKTRAALVSAIDTEYAKLTAALDDAGPGAGDRVCVDAWTVRDLMAIRLWWTRSTLDWVDAGCRGETLTLPAPGYKWNETPRLNTDIAAAARGEGLADLRAQLDAQVERLRRTIDALDDPALLQVGVFAWTGTWPVARWLSIGTARQYQSARTYIRRMLKADAAGSG